MSVVDRVNASYRQALAAPRPARVARSKAWAGEPPVWAVDNGMWMSSLPDRERIEHSFDGYARGAGKQSGVVFACFYARLRYYAQAKFLWQSTKDGSFSLPGEGDLSILDSPWPSATTGDLLSWHEVDASFAGNSYWTWADDEGRYGMQAAGPTRRLTRMRPDWVWILIGSKSGDPYALDARIVGFVYDPTLGGAFMGAGVEDRMVLLTPREVAHYKPIPDPEARFRGMSWITPVIREIQADQAATTHKQRYFERGAALQTIVALDKDVSTDSFDAFVERFKAMHEGADNAFGTLFVGGGADVTTTSSNLQQLDFSKVTGTAQTVIAANAGVHPTIVPLSEGMYGSSLNAGNFNAARRTVADGTLMHLWGHTTGSLANLVKAPRGKRLVVDPDMPFLRDDATDTATVQMTQAQALNALVQAGYKPDAAVEFLKTNDLGKLTGQHSGLYSVQLQEPGATRPGQPAEPPAPPPAMAASNGHREKGDDPTDQEWLRIVKQQYNAVPGGTW